MTEVTTMNEMASSPPKDTIATTPVLATNLPVSTNQREKKDSVNADEPVTNQVSPMNNFPLFMSLTLRSLGIIFGDIGTSPLYVVQTVFSNINEPSEQQCVGVISLIIWNLIVVVSIKYAIFILMADNRGEGGTFALCGLLTGESSPLRRKAKRVVAVISILAASLLIGDGALTPAISVLSAVEGLAISAPNLQNWILPITIIIIILLFLGQQVGTGRIGIAFGPVMIVWFLTLFCTGIWRVTFHPKILRAFNPFEALNYLLREKKTGFFQIGSIFLSSTGLEALYADLGHFGRWPVRTSWFLLVLPAVTMNYLGQGALLATNPTLITNPFYNAAPGWARWPLIILATISTIIASQAIITGCFSLISQASSLGFSPPFGVQHTSKTIIGQIYVPAINWTLMFLTLAVTLYFRSSSGLTHAYGVTVCCVMLITTVLYMCIIRYTWRRSWIFVVLFGVFLVIDCITLSSNLVKFAEGAWVALLIATFFFILGFCWYYGQGKLRRYLHFNSRTTSLSQLPRRFGLMNKRLTILPSDGRQASPTSLNGETNGQLSVRHHQEESNSDSESSNDEYHEKRTIRNYSNGNGNGHVSLVKDVEITTVGSGADFHSSSGITASITPGIGVFLTTSSTHTPHVFENLLSRLHAVPQVIIFLKISHAGVPILSNEKRLKIKTFGNQRIYHITARYGYSENKIHVLDILKLAASTNGVPISNEANITFFIPNSTIIINKNGWKTWITRWPLFIYAFLKSLYPGAAKDLALSPANTVSVGILARL